MSEKYCDHGLYGAAVVTGNTTNANATLTVTGVTSGVLGLGAMITGANIPAYAYISALGTGTGGAGTYTMSQNATATATGTTVTAKNGGPSLEPAWGVAQEGDGTALGAATAATVNIDLSAATAAAGATFSIMGAVLTCVASGAVANQFNAGSGAALVSNLVTAINRTTNTSVVAAQATGWGTPKVQDAVFARIGSPTTTLQIMTRAGSAQYNSSTIATSGLTGGTFGPYTFSSGAGGAWGYLLATNTTIWPSAVAVNVYGLWTSGSKPFAGVMNSGDNVNIRAGKSIYTMLGSSFTLGLPASLGAEGNPVRFSVDTNLIWTGDSATATLNIIHRTASNGFLLNINANASSFIEICGKKLASEDYNLKFSTEVSNASIVVNNHQTGNVTIKNANFTSYLGGAGIVTNQGAHFAAGVRPRLTNCNFKHSTGAAFLTFLSNWLVNLGLQGVTFDNAGNASANTNTINFSGGAGGCEADIVGLKLLNFVPGSTLCTANTGSYKLNFVDPIWGNVSARGPFCGAVDSWDYNRYVSSYSSTGYRDFSIDCPRGLVVWNSTLGQPTLNAVLPNGTYKWSFRLAPHTASGGPGMNLPLRTPKIAKINSLASGARTFTIEFCATDTQTWTKKDVSALITYADASGNNVILDTLDYDAGALTLSSATWSSEAVNAGNPEGGLLKATYVSGATLYHKKFKLEVPTPVGSDLPLGAEVGVYFRVHRNVANATQFLFVDPDVSIA
jgi:hypothetical protein